MTLAFTGRGKITDMKNLFSFFSLPLEQPLRLCAAVGLVNYLGRVSQLFTCVGERTPLLAIQACFYEVRLVSVCVLDKVSESL